MVERLVYTELVGGSNPSPRTIFRLNAAQTEEPASHGMPITHRPGRNTLNPRDLKQIFISNLCVHRASRITSTQGHSGEFTISDRFRPLELVFYECPISVSKLWSSGNPFVIVSVSVSSVV